MKDNSNEKQGNSRVSLHLYFKVEESFESHAITKEKNIFYCQSIKEKNQYIYGIQKQIDIGEQLRMLFRARKSKNNYYELIYPIVKMFYFNYDEIKKLDNRMWYVFKSKNLDNKYENENEEYNLLENDIIKLGKRKYEIIEKHISSSIPEIKNQLNEVNHQFGSIFYKFYPKYDKNQNNYCDICYKDISSEENPKVKICQCKSYIHYECLKNALDKNLTINEKSNFILYRHKYFNCKKCKSPYPYKFYINNKAYSLIDLKIPENNDYIILESLNSLEEKGNDKKQNIKNILVINLSEKEISLENGAIVKYNKNNNYLTIVNKNNIPVPVLIKGNAKIELNKKIFFQNGNVYIKAEYKEDQNIKKDNP